MKLALENVDRERLSRDPALLERLEACVRLRLPGVVAGEARPKKESLAVQLISARGLNAADSSLSSDPYASCRVRDAGGTAVQTRHLARTLEPVWDETLEIEDYRRGNVLDLSVWHHDKVGGDKCLGRRTMDAPFFLEWGFFEGEMQLELDGYGLLAFLTLKAEVFEIPPDPAVPTVQACDVQLVLGDNLTVDAKIRPSAGVPHQAVHASLAATQQDVCEAVAAALREIEGIDEVCTGELCVTCIVSPPPKPEASPPPEPEVSPQPEPEASPLAQGAAAAAERLAQEAAEAARQAEELALETAAAAQKAEGERLTQEAAAAARKAEEERLAQEAAAAARKAEEERLAQEAAAAARKAQEECLAQEAAEAARKAQEERLAQEAAAAARKAQEERLAQEAAAAARKAEEGRLAQEAVEATRKAEELAAAAARKAEEERLAQEAAAAARKAEEERLAQEEVAAAFRMAAKIRRVQEAAAAARKAEEERLAQEAAAAARKAQEERLAQEAAAAARKSEAPDPPESASKNDGAPNAGPEVAPPPGEAPEALRARPIGGRLLRAAGTSLSWLWEAKETPAWDSICAAEVVVGGPPKRRPSRSRLPAQYRKCGTVMHGQCSTQVRTVERLGAWRTAAAEHAPVRGRRCGLRTTGVCEKGTPAEKNNPQEYELENHQIRGRIGVSAAGSQSEGSHKRNAFFTDSGMI